MERQPMTHGERVKANHSVSSTTLKKRKKSESKNVRMSLIPINI